MRSGTVEMQRTRFSSDEQDAGQMTTDRDEGTYSSSMKARLNKKYRGKNSSPFKSIKSQEPLIKETPQIHKHEY